MKQSDYEKAYQELEKGLAIAQKGLGIGERARWQAPSKKPSQKPTWNKNQKKDWSELKLGKDKTVYR